MLLGKKIGMTQIFEGEKLIPVTVIEAGPNFVIQKKNVAKDGYNALTLGYDDKKEKQRTETIEAEIGKKLVRFNPDKQEPFELILTIAEVLKCNR